MTDRVRELEGRVTGYRTLDFDLESIARKIRETRSYAKDLQKQFDAVMERKRGLVLSYTDASMKEKLQARCEAQVLKELPESSFFDPGVEAT